MKNKITLTLASVLALNLAACSPAQKETPSTLIKEVTTGNVLLDAWAGPHGGVPPWDQVDVDNFYPDP